MVRVRITYIGQSGFVSHVEEVACLCEIDESVEDDGKLPESLMGLVMSKGRETDTGYKVKIILDGE